MDLTLRKIVMAISNAKIKMTRVIHLHSPRPHLITSWGQEEIFPAKRKCCLIPSNWCLMQTLPSLWQADVDYPWWRLICFLGSNFSPLPYLGFFPLLPISPPHFPLAFPSSSWHARFFSLFADELCMCPGLAALSKCVCPSSSLGLLDFHAILHHDLEHSLTCVTCRSQPLSWRYNMKTGKFHSA